MPTAAEVTAEYVKQIIQHVENGDDPTYIVTELLKEYGAKAYRQGREHLVETMTKLV
jgi:hypothetical protein